jgi:hypothetical protein
MKSTIFADFVKLMFKAYEEVSPVARDSFSVY